MERFRSGDVRALARAISLVERRDPTVRDLEDALRSDSRLPGVTGFTGAPGTGKSTLVDAVVSLLRTRKQSVAVLATDPNSPFTGGAIPVHLLTREAFGVYLRHLEPAEGILAVHISNDALDLRPVLAALAHYSQLPPIFVESWPTDDGCRASSWVLMARSPRTLSQPAIAQAGSPLVDSASSLLWTDDYSNLFRVLRH